MTIQTRHTTAEELLRMPDDGLRYELVRGELRRMTPAGNKHGYFTMNLSGPLHQHVKENGLGRVYTAETGFKLASNPDTVRAPDAAFVSQAHLDETGEVEGYWPGAPDLAVEVSHLPTRTRRSWRRPSPGSRRAAAWCWPLTPPGAP